MPIGIWRKRDGWASEDSVYVIHDQGSGMEMPVSRYREQGYFPDADRLSDWEDLTPDERLGSAPRQD